jgi:predicted transcriptional regulator
MSRRRRFEPEVYVALRSRRYSNREIARLLDVDEASVRRGLKKHAELLRERKRQRDRDYLRTKRGQTRARKFRLNAQLKRLNKSTEEIA